MKLKINIDANAKEPEIMITTADMSEEINRVVKFIGRLSNTTTIISGIKDDKIELLEHASIVRIYAQNGKVLAKTEHVYIK